MSETYKHVPGNYQTCITCGTLLYGRVTKECSIPLRQALNDALNELAQYKIKEKQTEEEREKRLEQSLKTIKALQERSKKNWEEYQAQRSLPWYKRIFM